MSYIFNLCIERGYWPEALKKAEIIPIIHKSGDKAQMTNYWPISLILNFAKIFKRIIHNRLSNFLNKKNVLADA